jgi:hypothetical protein
MSDRYLKLVLTVIALELLWLAAAGMVRPVSAQPGTMPVVITGIRLEANDESALPVVVTGTVTMTARGPLKIEADRPLPVQSVPYTPAERPGE